MFRTATVGAKSTEAQRGRKDIGTAAWGGCRRVVVPAVLAVMRRIAIFSFVFELGRWLASRRVSGESY